MDNDHRVLVSKGFLLVVCDELMPPAPPAANECAVDERVPSKAFVSPGVTGLSKREARLVKNRAAAFLSRQRKREELEM